MECQLLLHHWCKVWIDPLHIVPQIPSECVPGLQALKKIKDCSFIQNKKNAKEFECMYLEIHFGNLMPLYIAVHDYI